LFFRGFYNIVADLSPAQYLHTTAAAENGARLAGDQETARSVSSPYMLSFITVHASYLDILPVC
jgi:hypothetical protein